MLGARFVLGQVLSSVLFPLHPSRRPAPSLTFGLLPSSMMMMMMINDNNSIVPVFLVLLGAFVLFLASHDGRTKKRGRCRACCFPLPAACTYLLTPSYRARTVHRGVFITVLGHSASGGRRPRPVFYCPCFVLCCLDSLCACVWPGLNMSSYAGYLFGLITYACTCLRT